MLSFQTHNLIQCCKPSHNYIPLFNLILFLRKLKNVALCCSYLILFKSLIFSIVVLITMNLFPRYPAHALCSLKDAKIRIIRGIRAPNRIR